MTAALILNQSQAEAVYNAMCALNNVGAALECLLPLGGGKAVRVYEALNASVHVATEAGGRAWQSVERHESQSAFATAYGLDYGGAAELAAELARPLTATERALVDELVDGAAPCKECGGRGEVETGIGMMTCTSCPV